MLRMLISVSIILSILQGKDMTRRKIQFSLLFFVHQNIKLSSIKVDTRYTTTQQVVKLIGSHTISKVTVKIGDLKRTKMVRTINLYYNNRTVQAIVELKNKCVSTKSC